MSVYFVSVVGESFKNKDGTSRQAEIKRCSPGEPVEFRREPDNPHDANCVAVVSVRGRVIGNIGRDTPWICERIDRGAFVDATIASCGEGDGKHWGAVLQVRTDESDQFEAIGKGGAGCMVAMLFAPIALLLMSLSGQLSAAPPTEAGRDIAAFCHSRPACVATQRLALRHYLGLWVMYDITDAQAERCMRAGKGARYVDWTIAERCLRVRAKGRRGLLPGGPS